MNPNGYGMGGSAGIWLFATLLMLGVALIVVLAIRVLGGGIRPDRDGRARPVDRQPGRSRAREHLDQRYAHGDIDTEEYNQRVTAMGTGA